MRIAIVGFAVALALLFGVTAVDATRSVVAAVDPTTRHHFLPIAVGAWLKVIGVLGLYGSLAVSFRDWPTFILPFAPVFGSLGRRSGLRRARRQIDGEESYDASEVERLRVVARYRLALITHSTGSTVQAGSVSLILLFVGMLLQPADLGHALGRAYQVLAIVMIVVLLVSLPFTRKRTDPKAQAFLLRTTQEGAETT